ncbi:MAG: hypothetical protein O3B31_09730 [Chloroflexi bacterium]|nr:hypothetical protein [Chloroflexota bacterium]MDA1003606.1 hypothetical protein [Chloroflexota bacterium]
MLWQDVVLSLGGFFVAATQVPMLRAAEKPPLATSMPLVFILTAISISLFSLDLKLAALGCVIQGTLWAILAVTRLRATREAAHFSSPIVLAEQHSASLDRAA